MAGDVGEARGEVLLLKLLALQYQEGALPEGFEMREVVKV